MTSKMVFKQPQPVMVHQESNEWGSRICDCCEDVPMCCCGFWCLPCFACMTAKKYGECLCLPLVDCLLSPIVHPVAMSTRVSMRHLYGIRGSMFNDCVCATFCTACVWCQMAREMKARAIDIVLVNKHSKTLA
ncbi:cornifelin homolog B-like [Syngnathus typhle]|uniref:cornifelin homolog B-like n=1 Tax=Syngnathus typhle TaxID=161592 RepID=UPI002A6AF93E|nr:cornifelin homolog B-like [Syngnathus typhle]XP_061155977.1 cornifelin homolog B-like [Syngnathus typhle]